MQQRMKFLSFYVATFNSIHVRSQQTSRRELTTVVLSACNKSDYNVCGETSTLGVAEINQGRLSS